MTAKSDLTAEIMLATLFFHVIHKSTHLKVLLCIENTS